MKQKLYKAVVINGEYAGRQGQATKANDLDLAMFYSKEGIYPYRVCLSVNDIEYKED